MINPWDLKTDNKRESDNLYSFIIFCEDSVCEPCYFECFETNKIKVTTIKNQNTNFKNVSNAISKCLSDGILEKKSNGYAFSNEGIEIWCVFDRDKSIVTKTDVDFNLAIQLAELNNLNVAWSNDCFELWILLHLEDVNKNLQNYNSRIDYYGELKKYFESHSNPNEYLQKALLHNSFGYKNSLKSEKNFKNIVLPEILKNTNIAIERAKILSDLFKSEDDISKKQPCTLVFELVEKLLEKGGKDLP
jgi:hypothetical protein